MAYELRLSDLVQGRIREYVRRYSSDGVTLANAIEERLNMLARDPEEGSSAFGPYPVPIHRFSLKDGDMSHHLQIAYTWDDAEKAVHILDFRTSPM